MKHRTTDPACVEFAGPGREWRLFGLSVRSPRRVRFDYMRGVSCPVCRPPALSLAPVYDSEMLSKITERLRSRPAPGVGGLNL